MIARAAQLVGVSWLVNLGQDRLLRGFGLLGLGEGVNRISRIVATIILARYLSAVEFGIAATAITCFELVRVLANNGLSQMVVRASDDALAATCNTAYRVTLWLCMFMAMLQLVAGARQHEHEEKVDQKHRALRLSSRYLTFHD